MAKIILSCGHTVPDMQHAFEVITKSTDRIGEKALAFKVVCGPCEDSYRQHGELFETFELGEHWLEQDTW